MTWIKIVGAFIGMFILSVVGWAATMSLKILRIERLVNTNRELGKDIIHKVDTLSVNMMDSRRQLANAVEVNNNLMRDMIHYLKIHIENITGNKPPNRLPKNGD